MSAIDDYRRLAADLEALNEKADSEMTAADSEASDRLLGRLDHLWIRCLSEADRRAIERESIAKNHRAALVRILVARDWSTAMALIHADGVCLYSDGVEHGWDLSTCCEATFRVASLPCAADVVDAFIKEQENR